MNSYRVTGTIMLESTREEAAYDFVMGKEDGKPDEMDILRAMMLDGELQILHEDTEEVTE